MFMGKLNVYDDDFDVYWDGKRKLEFASILITIPAFIENVGPAMIEDMLNAKLNGSGNYDELSTYKNIAYKYLQKK